MTKSRFLFRMVLLFLLGYSLSMYYNVYYVKDINPKLLPHYKEFMLLVRQKCKPSQYRNSGYKIDFSYEPLFAGKVIGVCRTYEYSSKFEISIDKSYWDTISEDEKFRLISHELLHCLFSIDHSEKQRDIMFESMTLASKDISIAQINRYLTESCR